ncbi:MAG TPA: hypothetical protein VL132_15005 [Planctomycetaceae bacterium]|nr:hypothetical protein [Planctomycetaceae bacterium]
MSHHQKSLVCATTVVLLTAGALWSTAWAKPPQEEPRPVARIFQYHATLKAADKLQDGDSGPAIALDGETMLIWIDRMPEARYAHPTEYVLISGQGTRVVKGDRWPVLNGRPLFRDGQKFQIKFPREVVRG